MGRLHGQVHEQLMRFAIGLDAVNGHYYYLSVPEPPGAHQSFASMLKAGVLASTATGEELVVT